MTQPAGSKRMPISVGSLLWIALIVWLLTPGNGASKRQLEALRGEVAELRQELGLLRKAIDQQRVVPASVQPAPAISAGGQGAAPVPDSGPAGAIEQRGRASASEKRSGESGAAAVSREADLENQPIERE